jgi:OmpA-OmpF porin, OOP family
MHNFDASWSDLGHSVYQAGGSPSNDDRANYAPFPGGYPPNWGVGVNLMYSSDIRAPGSGTLSGTVTDAITGERIAATVAFPGTAVDPVMSNSQTGFYSAKLPQGSVAVTVNSPGYIAAGTTLQVEGGVDMTRDYALQPEQGLITGTVTDLDTGLPINGATVSIGQVSDNTDSNGSFSLSIIEGSHTVTATARGYLNAERPINVVGGESVRLDIQLRPALVEGQVLSFNDIYFDFDSSNIKPESYSVLNSIVEMFIEDADVRIQIAGHTDSDGSNAYNQSLSERRAQSVYSYLVDHGVQASRLTTIGLGESQPVVPNTSAANKALNRRIEFTVLGR